MTPGPEVSVKALWQVVVLWSREHCGRTEFWSEVVQTGIPKEVDTDSGSE